MSKWLRGALEDPIAEPRKASMARILAAVWGIMGTAIACYFAFQPDRDYFLVAQLLTASLGALGLRKKA